MCITSAGATITLMKEHGENGAGEIAPTEEKLRAFGRGWIEYLDLDPDEDITYRRADGSMRTIPLGDFALVSEHSIGEFSRLGDLIAEHGPDHPEVAKQTAYIMSYVDHYRGVQAPPTER